MSAETLHAELYGGPRDGEYVPLPTQVPRTLEFPVPAHGAAMRTAVYRFGRQMGHATVRYEYAGTE